MKCSKDKILINGCGNIKDFLPKVSSKNTVTADTIVAIEYTVNKGEVVNFMPVP